MTRAANVLLLSFLVAGIVGLNGCGSETPGPGPAVSPATSAATTPPTATTTAATPPATAESTPRAKSKAKAAPEALPLNGEPKLLLSEEEIRDGWIQLFDGQTLAGWTPTNNVDWHLTDDGFIEASQGEPGLLLTTVPFADFELRCDYWVAKDGNSGIFLRSAPEPTNPTKDCYEFNLFDSREQFGTGSLVGRAEPIAKSLGEEKWRTAVIKVEGNHFTASLDGEAVLDFKDETENLLTSGRIGLQKNAGLVRFRNVFVKPLNMKSLFNSKDLSGWHPVAGSKSKFEVADAAISVSNGPGFLESNDAWSDFVLQFEAQANGDGLNSGVFFRLIPGTEDAPSNGYELQIENVFAQGDRTQPKDDAGTGSIFRRTKARWVVPNDHEWFTMTLIAHGPRIATWVNGFQITDWEDTRPADPNPRRGSKTEAGPISLQGHDPTTDIQFRNLRIATYPESH
ncbi:MAG: DUF1080 domain-containing protein [Rhodopirellula sp.]|nr:DUF1080 domain-containing protein [Rhodopirellula sp.]